MSKEILFHKIKKLFISYFRLFGLYILFFIGVALLQSIFPYLDLKKYSQDGIFEIIKDNKFKAFLTLVVFAPVIEELMFRTLLKPKSKELLLFLSSWTLFIFSLCIPTELELIWYYKYLIFIISISGMFFIYQQLISEKYLERCKNFLDDHQIIMLQITAVLFGFLHIFNYVDVLKMDSVLFLLIVPRILAGHIFGKLKIENDHIIWPILLHAINNGVVFLLISNRF